MSDAAFGKPLVTNVQRGAVAEAIIAFALEPEWTWCGADYASWDFERADGVRLEVKQSACKQSWHTEPHIKVRPSFDISPRRGRWEGDTWFDEPGRSANIYIFAYHGVADEHADHRDPGQWEFYVVPTSILPPDQQRIALGSVRRLARPFTYPFLRDCVNDLAASIHSNRTIS